MEEKMPYPWRNMVASSIDPIHYYYLGRRIAEIRKARRMSQQMLAKKAGVSRSYISKIECGVAICGVTLHILLIIAHSLQVELSFLLHLRKQDIIDYQLMVSEKEPENTKTST